MSKLLFFFEEVTFNNVQNQKGCLLFDSTSVVCMHASYHIVAYLCTILCQYHSA